MIDIKTVPNKFFTVSKDATWEDDVSYEVTIDDVNLDQDWDKWTAFVFEKTENDTIRPTSVISDYEPMSTYATDFNNSEVWILMLPIENFDEETQVVLHKKWLKKAWFYYQGFVVADKTEIVKDVFKDKGSLFEEIHAITSSQFLVDSLDSFKEKA